MPHSGGHEPVTINIAELAGKRINADKVCLLIWLAIVPMYMVNNPMKNEPDGQSVLKFDCWSPRYTAWFLGVAPGQSMKVWFDSFYVGVSTIMAIEMVGHRFKSRAICCMHCLSVSK